MRRILAIVLLAFLPFQFSWAAVASYCGHEEQSGASHFGHHEHRHHADAGASAEPAADRDAPADATGDKAPGATDLDCGHCHGTCSALPALRPALPGALAAAPSGPSLDEACGAQAAARPERPQWLRFA